MYMDAMDKNNRSGYTIKNCILCMGLGVLNLFAAEPFLGNDLL